MNLSPDRIEDLRETVESDYRTLISDLVKIAQTPAPTFEEEERAQLMESLYHEYGVDVIDRDDAGNVIAQIKEKDVDPVCLVAHLDTVFDRSVNHTVQLDDRTIEGPGVGDDSLALASQLSALRNLRRNGAIGNLWLVATTGTEGDGNLRGSRHFVKQNADEVGFSLCLEGHRLGRIDYWSLGTKRIRIRVESEGGHVWRDETGRNPIAILGEVVTQIRKLGGSDHKEATSLVNLGMIEGGSAYNTVPYEAELSVEVRASENDVMNNLTDRINEIISGTNEQYPANITIEGVTERPASGIPEDHWLVQTIKSVHETLDIRSQPGAASSDSSLFLEAGIPTATLGLARGANKHRTNETIHLDSVQRGQLQLLMSVIEGANTFQRQSTRST